MSRSQRLRRDSQMQVDTRDGFAIALAVALLLLLLKPLIIVLPLIGLAVFIAAVSVYAWRSRRGAR